VDANAVIRFPRGLIGFPSETHFVLLRRSGESHVGWLQSIHTSHLAFPVVSVDALAVDYPDVPLQELVACSGVAGGADAVAIMAVVTASGAGIQATVNLLSPIVVNADTRTGSQVVLERTRYSTQEPFRIRAKSVPTQREHAPSPSP